MDAFGIRFAERVVGIWSKLTGRNWAALALFTRASATILLAVHVVARIAYYSTVDIQAFIFSFMLVSAVRSWTKFTEIIQHVNDLPPDGDTVSRHPAAGIIVTFLVAISIPSLLSATLVIGLMFAVPQAWFIGLMALSFDFAMFSFVAMICAMVARGGGGKTIWATAREKIASAVDSLLPSPSPVPA